MGKKKKLLSLLISVTMVIAMFPALVSADEEPGTFTELQELIDANYWCTLVLDKDYKFDPDKDTGALQITDYIEINLNGHTIDRSLGGETAVAQEDGHVFVISSPTNSSMWPWLMISDSTKGKITGGYAYNGGGIYVEDGGVFTLTGGSITGNRVDSTGKGAGVFLGTPATGYPHALKGGEIIANTGAMYGGGVYAETGANVTLSYTSTNTNYTKISGNEATYGAGIYNKGTLNIEYISISGNTASSLGGGIYQAGGELKMQDIPVVENNTGGDVYLPEGEVITIAGSMNASANVGISGASDQVVTANYGYAAVVDPNSVFFPSDDSMTIALNDAGEVVLQGGQQVVAKAVFMGHTLTLGNELGYNFYVDLSTLDDDMKASSEMVFEIPGRGINTPQTVTYAESSDETIQYEDPDTHETKTGTFRKFTCKLSPVQMGETIKATFYYGDKTEVNESKVEDYLAWFDDNDNPATRVLVQATADYGYYLQQYLSKLEKWSIVDRTTDDSNDGYAAITKHYNEYNSSTFTTVAGDLLTNGYKAQLTPGAASIKKVSYTLDTRSTTTLEVFFEVEQGTVFTVDQEGFDVRLVKDTKNGQTRYRYRVRIENLLAQQLGTKFTISGTADGDRFEVSVSPLSYVLTVLNSNNYTAARQNAAAALFFYYTHANSYSGN